MSNQRLTITIDLQFAALAALMVLFHGIGLVLINPRLVAGGLERLQDFHPQDNAIRIQLPPRMPKLRTLGRKDGSKKNNVLVAPKTAKYDRSKPIDPFKAAAAMNRPFKPTQPQRAVQPKQAPGRPKEMTGAPRATVAKNGARPGSASATRMNQSALDRMAVTGRPVQEAAAQTSTQVAGQATIANSPILSKSNVNMQVEVPEGVAEDELNEYELMFYGFQKRMMEKYLGSIMLQVREYERRYPHKSLIPDGKHVMTGRVTFDSSGNIKQIKMVRWSQAEGLQSLFEDVLKSMDSVPNPPKKLWNKEGDFVVFYNLTVNNG